MKEIAGISLIIAACLFVYFMAEKAKGRQENAKTTAEAVVAEGEKGGYGCLLTIFLVVALLVLIGGSERATSLLLPR